MDMLLYLESPISEDDIFEIEKLNRELGSIVAPFSKNEFDWYDISTYLFQSMGFNNNIYCILDSNITTELCGLVSNKDINKQSTRNALVLLCFLHLSEVDIDPGISLAEYSTTANNPDSVQRLHNFRLIDNLPTEHLVDIVLGRIFRLDISLSRYHHDPQILQQFESSEDVNHWKMYYTFSLKIYLIANTSNNRKDKIIEFISWIWSDFLFSSAAITFAFVYFSDSYGKMLKGVKSKNLKKVMKGIRNASWDMTIISYWSEKNVKRDNKDPCYIFCTEDKALREVATFLLGHSGVESKGERLRCIMGSALYKNDVDEIVAHHDMLEAMMDSDARMINSESNMREYFDKCIENLENEIKENLMNAQQNT